MTTSKPFYASESIEPINDGHHFEYLEEGNPVTISRQRAFELRAEGLEAFREDLKTYFLGVKDSPAAPVLFDWTMKVLQDAAPLYFWVIPSSSSGKYHPPFSQGEQGLVKHVLAGVYFVAEFARTFGLNATDTACAISAMAIHDLCKYGLSYDVRYFGVHECLVRVKLGYKETGLDKDLPKELYDKVIRAVEHHNGNLIEGLWTSFRTPPPDDICRCVHIADYTVSRKKFHYDI